MGGFSLCCRSIVTLVRNQWACCIHRYRHVYYETRVILHLISICRSMLQYDASCKTPVLFPSHKTAFAYQLAWSMYHSLSFTSVDGQCSKCARPSHMKNELTWNRQLLHGLNSRPGKTSYQRRRRVFVEEIFLL